MANEMARRDTTIGSSKRFQWWIPVIVAGTLALPSWAGQLCEWRMTDCLDFRNSEVESVQIPANVTRLAPDAIRICRNLETLSERGQADIVYIMDNTTSMNRSLNGNPPGDPYGQRDTVIHKALDMQRALASVTTAGFINVHSVGYRVDAAKAQRPLEISAGNSQGRENLNRLKHKVTKVEPYEALPKIGASAKAAATYWSDVLDSALFWLDPANGLTRTSNQAIIMVADGDADDWRSRDIPSRLENLPPVYGIFLGNSSNARFLDTITARTGGKLYIVEPQDTTGLRQVMESIVGGLIRTQVPARAEIVNATLGAGHMGVAESAGIVGDPDGWRIRTEELIALNEGQNRLEIALSMQDPESGKDSLYRRTLELRVDGPEVSGSSEAYSCRDPARLLALNAQGKPMEYATWRDSLLDMRLVGGPNGLATTSLQSGGQSGDAETVSLERIDEGGNSIHQGRVVLQLTSPPQPAGSDGRLQADLGGDLLVFRWRHPRDARDTARLELEVRNPTVAKPEASPPGHQMEQPTTVKLRSETEDAVIWYTLDRSTPMPGSDGTLRYNPNVGIALEAHAELTAIATKPGWNDSPALVEVYERTARSSIKVLRPVSETGASATMQEGWAIAFPQGTLPPELTGDKLARLPPEALEGEAGKEQAGLAIESNLPFQVHVQVYSHLGELVHTVHVEVPEGAFTQFPEGSEPGSRRLPLVWSQQDHKGSPVGTGAYIYRVTLRLIAEGQSLPPRTEYFRVGVLRKD